MYQRVGSLATVLIAILVITATGPAVAYHSQQALPALTTPTADDEDGVSQSTDPVELKDVLAPEHSLAWYLNTIAYSKTDPVEDGQGPGNDNGNDGGNGQDPGNGNGTDGDNGQGPGNGNDGGNGQDPGNGNDGGNGQNPGDGNDGDNGQGNDGDNGQGPGNDNGQGNDRCSGTHPGDGNGQGHGSNQTTGHRTNTTGTGPPGCRGQGPPFDVENGDVDLGPNATALEHRLAARTLLRTLNISGPGNSEKAFEQQRKRLLAQLNSTFAHHLDEHRATSAALFRSDHRVAAPLQKKAPNVTKHLVASDRLLAEQAITDAERVRTALNERNVSYDETAVHQNITDARRAYQQAQRQPSQSQHAAIEHYRQAWTHAQRAIDIMDEAVRPNVTLERTRNLSLNATMQNPLVGDFPRNNSSTLTVSGTVFDIRGYELTTTFTVNNTTYNLTLETGTAPLSTVSFNRTVELDRQWPAFENGSLATTGTLRTYAVNVTVHDPGVDIADQGYDSDDQEDLHHPQTGGAAYYFDGDGLPGWYERQVVGTDPLDPDTDGDGVIDGVEDPDNESLNNFRELLAGTDPLNPDTDADNLTDAFELRWGYDPLARDTDSNGTPDGQEDPDADGLVNVREQDHGTFPRLNDSDRDGLEDGREVDSLGTDPLAYDTDDDRLSDPSELELPTDPTDPDTDDDGIIDGNETFTTTARNESLGVSAAVTGEGDAAECLTIRTETGVGFDYSHITSVSASDVVRLRCSGSFHAMTVTIAYDESQVTTNESDLAIYRYDRDSQQFHKLASTVNAANDTVQATATSVGSFVVMASTSWEAQIPDEDDQARPTVDKESFEVDLSECSGFCDSDGGGITIGVTTDGKADYPGAGSQTSAVKQVRSTAIPGVTTATFTESTETTTQEGVEETATNESRVEAPGAAFTRTETNTSVVYSTNDTIGTLNESSGSVRMHAAGAATTVQNTTVTTIATIDTSGASQVYLDFRVTGRAKFGATHKLVANGQYGTKTLFTVSCSGSDCVKDKEGFVDEGFGGIAGNELKLQVVSTGTGGISTHDMNVTFVFDGDGDGIPDGDDLCTNTAGVGENGCPNSTYDAITLTFDSPLDTIQISAAGESYVERSGSKVTLEVLDNDGNSYTVFSDSSVDSSAESFGHSETNTTITNVGSRITIRLRATGTAALHLSSLQLRVDADGDGFWNRQELVGLWNPRFGVMKMDPYSVDTDGDGLRDDEEIGKHVASRHGTYHEVNSLPTRVDSDGDGLADPRETGSTAEVIDKQSDKLGGISLLAYKRTEGVNLRSSPLESDTDGDGTLDGFDNYPVITAGAVAGKTITELRSGAAVHTAGAVRATGGQILLEVIDQYAKGLYLGEAGNIQLARNTFDADPTAIPYFAGWMVGVIAPGVDVFFDWRDCAASVVQLNPVNSLLDCGGAIVSTPASISSGIGAVVGALGLPETGGASSLIALATYAVDFLEDAVTDIPRILWAFAKTVPPAKFDQAALLTVKMLGPRVGDVLAGTAKYVEKVPVASGIYTGLIEASLRHSSGLSKADASRLINTVGLDTAAKIAASRRGDEALRLIDETEDGAEVLRKLAKLDADELSHLKNADNGAEALKNFLRFSTGPANEAREGLTRLYGEGWLSVSDVATYSSDVSLLGSRVPGVLPSVETLSTFVNKPINKYTFNNVIRAIHEPRVVVDRGVSGVRAMDQKVAEGVTKPRHVSFDWGRVTNGMIGEVVDTLDEIPFDQMPSKITDNYDSWDDFVRKQLNAPPNSLDIDIRGAAAHVLYVEAKGGDIGAADLAWKWARLKLFALATGREAELVLAGRLSKADALGKTDDAAVVKVFNELRELENVKYTRSGSELDFPKTGTN